MVSADDCIRGQNELYRAVRGHAFPIICTRCTLAAHNHSAVPLYPVLHSNTELHPLLHSNTPCNMVNTELHHLVQRYTVAQHQPLCNIFAQDTAALHVAQQHLTTTLLQS